MYDEVTKWDFNAIDRHKTYEFKWNNLLNVLNVQITMYEHNSGVIDRINMKWVCSLAVSHTSYALLHRIAVLRTYMRHIAWSGCHISEPYKNG